MSLSDLFNFFFGRPDPEPAPAPSIAAIASGNENFDILVAALDATGLTQTFIDPGDFTVFAPTDAAFRELATTTFGLDVSELSDGEVAVALVETLGAETVKNVLLYHVKAGATDVAHLQADGSVTTLLGADFAVAGNVLIDADPQVENPTFIAGLTDIQASNGVIQAIDRVLLPIDVAEVMTRPTITELADSNAAFETLDAALDATGLAAVTDSLDADFTVFAPTDDAFRALASDLGLDVSELTDADVAGALVGALGAELVTNVLLYHVSAGAKSLAELQETKLVDTAFAGNVFAVDGTEIIDAEPDVTNATFIDGLTDIELANGTVHAIDRVILPVDLSPEGEFTRGTRDEDVIFGGAGDDGIFGRKGDDLLIGGAGNDRIGGNGQHDTIIGGAGDDRVWGGWGNDTIIDGTGNDKYLGGFGADTFDFSNQSGHDIVRDFFGADELILSKADFADIDAVNAASSTNWRGTTIETEDGSITLNWVYHLDEDDITFV